MKDGAAEKAEAVRALKAPGARRIRLKADLKAVDAELRPLVREAVRVEIPVRQIAAATGLTTNTVMLWGRP